jgi:putative salt-induced outer membrane protein
MQQQLLLPCIRGIFPEPVFVHPKRQIKSLCEKDDTGMRKSVVCACAAMALMECSGFAQENEDARWTGEGSLSAAYTTGNTTTNDLGASLNLARETQVWKASLEAFADFGETDNVETRNRWFLAGQLDRQINDRLYGFGRVSYEKDEFSGFDSRVFAGGGLGYQILADEPTTWSIEGGPGIKIDKIANRIAIDENGNEIAIPSTTEESVSVIGASNFVHAFNENVSFSNNTDILFAEESTQLANIAAITAKLTQSLSARASFETRHDTNPPPGFEDTDTATRLSLVYAFN